jgi:hypothetical protein
MKNANGSAAAGVTFAPPATVRNLDLTVDGRDDYIVDFHDTECAGRHSRCRRDREWTEEALISPTRF